MIASTHPLFGVHQKIKRADKHVRDLNRTVDSFVKSKPYALALDTKRELRKNTEYVYQIVSARQPPPRTPLIIGDALHNLRSSLNYLAIELCRLRGKSRRGVQFPIARSPDNFCEEVCKAHVDSLGEELIKKIESVQPYKPKFGSLAHLNSLNNRDKHRTLVITSLCGAVILGTGVADLPRNFEDIDLSKPLFQTFNVALNTKKIEFSFVPAVHRFPQPKPLQKGDVLPPISILRHLKLKHDPEILVEIAIQIPGDGEFFHAEIVLSHILATVKRVVAEFEGYFD